LKETIRQSREILDRATLALKDKVEDESARDLLNEVRNLAQRMMLLDNERNRTERNVKMLAADVASIHARVQAWCEAHRVRYLTIDSSPTIVMSKDVLDAIRAMDRGEEIEAAVEAMKDRASEPPAEIMSQILEDQLVPPKTIPAPPETFERFADDDDVESER
jgi:hypothetical protein